MTIIVNKVQIEKFLDNYNIGKLILYCRMKKGFGNLIYKIITEKGKFILKIAIRNNPIMVKYEIELLNYIKRLSTPQLIRDKNNKILLNFNNTNKAFIYKYIDGKTVHSYSCEMVSSVGEFLGKLHNQTIKFNSNIRRLEFYNISKKSFNKMIFVSKKTKNKKIKNAVLYIERQFLNYILPKSLPRGAMHIDLKAENVLIKNKKISGIIDFDNSYNGPLIFDLANTIMWFCSKGGNFDFEKAILIFSGYIKKRKLLSIEKRFFYKALHYSFLSHMLVDIYLLVSKKDRLSHKYIIWGIENLLETQKNLNLLENDFNKMFKLI
ncbi:phosphotransferase [Patescibacteria group bacterium]|nr:phosphotransferase [Patescibacteria group bacterium]